MEAEEIGSGWNNSQVDDILATMKLRANFLKRPLNWVFAASSHLAVLRVLKDTREGMSGRAVARAAGFTHQACRQAIAKLETMGIIRRQGAGKTQLIQLNFDNLLVQEAILPLFEAEKKAMGSLRSSVRKEFEGRALSATVFGSVARKEEEPGSDLDLLLVAPKGSRDDLLEKAASLGRKTLAQYGLRVSPIVMTVAEARQRARRSEPLLANILSEGVDVLESRLEDVIR